MPKKNHFIIIDSETTIKDTVADFAAVVTDTKGNIINQCAVLIRGVYDDQENSPLFHNQEGGELWARRNLPKRYAKYNAMLDGGSRMIASVAAVNRWLDNANHKYNPYLTAYNLPFDLAKCANTGIDLTQFQNSFCLWDAAYSKWATSKKFLQFALDCHAFNPPTKKGNMTFKTNAEIMARFVTGNPELEDEPHTALEDIIFYELPILKRLLEVSTVKKIMQSNSYSWQNCQVRDYFKAR